MEFHSGICKIPEDNFRNIYSRIRCLKHEMFLFFYKNHLFSEFILLCTVQKAILGGKLKFYPKDG